LRLFVTHMN